MLRARLQIALGMVRPATLLVVLMSSCSLQLAAYGAVSGHDSENGPYIADPKIIEELDCPHNVCNGPLNFSKLIQKQFKSTLLVPRPGTNPFMLPEAKEILETIQRDLEEIKLSGKATDGQLSPDFLTDPNSRVELVGIINRMDRQSIRDQKESECGEISAIYRFSYSIRDDKQASRLPVTINVVFPATSGHLTCQAAARRWLALVELRKSEASQLNAADLVNPDTGPIAGLVGGNIVRLEINMQAYRKAASQDQNNFETEATYLMRVFRWSEPAQKFQKSYLPN